MVQFLTAAKSSRLNPGCWGLGSGFGSGVGSGSGTGMGTGLGVGLGCGLGCGLGLMGSTTTVFAGLELLFSDGAS